MIYTSYFAKVNNLPEHIVPISIALKPPKGYRGLQYRSLMPTYAILAEWKATGDKETYVEEYDDKILLNLKPQKVVAELMAMVPPDVDIALICYEKPVDFCHRHLVANWLSGAGFPCAEYNF